jgi:hypothetical protein
MEIMGYIFEGIIFFLFACVLIIISLPFCVIYFNAENEKWMNGLKEERQQDING